MTDALLHSLPDAAARLGISRRTLEREIADGEIAYVMVRGAVRVAQADIEGYIARHRRYNKAEPGECLENVVTFGTPASRSTAGALKSLVAQVRAEKTPYSSKPPTSGTQSTAS